MNTNQKNNIITAIYIIGLGIGALMSIKKNGKKLLINFKPILFSAAGVLVVSIIIYRAIPADDKTTAQKNLEKSAENALKQQQATSISGFAAGDCQPGAQC